MRKKKISIKKINTEHIMPTKERTNKFDYEILNKKRIKINNLKLLHEKGDIDGNAFTSAQWWLNDYLYAYFGYVDSLNNSFSVHKEKGDLITFNMSKAQAGLRIKKIQKTLGFCVHERLRIFLIEEVSFTELGKIFYPNKDETSARKSAQAQMALILTQLSEFYLEEHKNKKREKLLAKAGRIVYKES